MCIKSSVEYRHSCLSGPGDVVMLCPSLERGCKFRFQVAHDFGGTADRTPVDPYWCSVFAGMPGRKCDGKFRAYGFVVRTNGNKYRISRLPRIHRFVPTKDKGKRNQQEQSANDGDMAHPFLHGCACRTITSWGSIRIHSRSPTRSMLSGFQSWRFQSVSLTAI